MGPSRIALTIKCAMLISTAMITTQYATTAIAQSVVAKQINLPSQPLAKTLTQIGRQTGTEVVFSAAEVRSHQADAVRGTLTAHQALTNAIRGTPFKLRVTSQGVYAIEQTTPLGFAPLQVQPFERADIGNYDEIVVTAQKKAESIQDVPISVSAFSADTLDELKIEGGAELLRAVPNVTFSKSNFASYNFSIRGIGTKALSVTSDPAVAISFNNTPLIRNRLFEQEYFDVDRVEVLRGPQGTLYGRNATGGVVNMIPKIAELDKLSANFKLETGNYESRRGTGTLNIPIGNTLALRAAGAFTKRDGYDFNSFTGNRVNGRDLWSTRISGAWQPSERVRVNAVWEHFYENDNRSRTGKQLCHTDPGPTSVGTVDITSLLMTRGTLSQGCSVGSLYDEGAYGVPNGFSLPYVLAAAQNVTLGVRVVNGRIVGSAVTLIDPTIDPYSTTKQSQNLREISTEYDPTFEAKNDVFQINTEIDLSSNLKVNLQSSYSKDHYYSTQDYNRFTSAEAFNNSLGLYQTRTRPAPTDGISPNGILSDPQLGESSRILGVDMVNSNSDQWYHELRISSSFDKKLNFNIGANYLKFKIDESYYVFNNVFTAIARNVFGFGNGGNEPADCDVMIIKDSCAYVDPNALTSINGEGHNYFRSRNVAETESLAGFGELYFSPSDIVKFTLGVRYTDDKKTATPYPTQLLLAPGFVGGGNVYKGYPASEDIVQSWHRLTGRFVVDWKPNFDFTDQTLIYTSFARGYKGGGANPPGIDANPEQLQFFPQAQKFKPETVNAFEIGMKNALDGGRLIINGNAFFYNYKGYQVSQIVDRMALNENFDANIWGGELEASWRVTPRLRLNSNIGYLKTHIKDGMQSIDVMNRTQGNPEWMLVKPWAQLSSNCIAPVDIVEKILKLPFYNNQINYLTALCGGSYNGSYTENSQNSLLTGIVYDPAVDAPNQGRGFYADLGGNELPNSPKWTLNLGAQYSLPLKDWNLTLRGDYYRQGKSWARVYNTEIDRLNSWSNTNISLTLDRPDSDFAIQLYVKNVFKNTPITDAFLNSDDSGLTVNAFTLDPRIYGLNVSKSF